MRRVTIWTDEPGCPGPLTRKILWVYDGEGRGRDSYYEIVAYANGRRVFAEIHKRRPEPPHPYGIWIE